MSEHTIAAPTSEAMQELGRRVAGMVHGGDVLLLSGPLGAGKTTFAQGFGAGLDITEPIVSPTFTIARELDGHFADGTPAHLVHVDAYRLGGSAYAPGQDAIGRLLDDPAFDARDALAGHLRELHARKQRLDGLIASVEKTLACMEGSATMEDEEKFEAFKQGLVGENEQHYGKEVRERWGDDAADASNAKLMGMSVEQYRQTQKLEQGVKDALAAAMAAGDPTGEDAHRAADLHRQWLCEFWKDGTYSKAAHLGLAEMYVADDRFKAYYEAVAPGAAEFLRDAIKAYCA